jgi:hypothetical protein
MVRHTAPVKRPDGSDVAVASTQITSTLVSASLLAREEVGMDLHRSQPARHASEYVGGQTRARPHFEYVTPKVDTVEHPWDDPLSNRVGPLCA